MVELTQRLSEHIEEYYRTPRVDQYAGRDSFNMAVKDSSRILRWGGYDLTENQLSTLEDTCKEFDLYSGVSDEFSSATRRSNFIVFHIAVDKLFRSGWDDGDNQFRSKAKANSRRLSALQEGQRIYPIYFSGLTIALDFLESQGMEVTGLREQSKMFAGVYWGILDAMRPEEE
jgi:hypothetical protein